MNSTPSDTTIPSRRYTCIKCGSKGRRNNKLEYRMKKPICPSCEKHDNQTQSMTCTTLNGKDVALSIGSIMTLAAVTASNPRMIIDRLTGVLFTEDEAKDLMSASDLQRPIFDLIISDMLPLPSTSLDAQKTDAETCRNIERDNYRSALERIEEIFVDGDNTYDDWEDMGKIARDILEDPNLTK